MPSSASRPTDEDTTPGLAVARLLQALPAAPGDADARGRRLAAERPLIYPLGSGQADEVALRAGLRPMIRELLPVSELGLCVERYSRAGYACAVSGRVYWLTHDGWDATADDFPAEHPQARRALFVSRAAQSLGPAVDCDENKSDASDRELGRLLGYPRCCVDAFIETSAQRRNTDLCRAALARTPARPAARLNVLDMSIFHYVSWFPCSYACELSLRYADAVAASVAEIDASFVRALDAGLALHRLLLIDEVQLTLDGDWDGSSVGNLRSVRPAARWRHPSARLRPEEEECVVRAWALLNDARSIRVDGSGLCVDDGTLELPSPPLLVPFGASSTE